MRKFYAVFLAAVLCFALCACEFGEIPDYKGKLGELEIPNPVVPSDADGVKAVIGTDLIIPEGASDAQYSVINGTLGQVCFVYDGNGYTFRAMKTDAAEDISGVYFTDCDSFYADDCLIRCDSQYGTATWYSDGLSYSVSMDISDDGALVNMYELLK